MYRHGSMMKRRTPGFAHLGQRASLTAMAVAMVMTLSAVPAFGIINPTFTPADMVRSSERVLLLEIPQPRNGAVTARVKDTLRGKAPAHPALTLDVKDMAPAVVAAYGGQESVSAVLFLSKEETGNDDDPAGAVLVESLWFSVHKKDGQLALAKDEMKLFSMWAGNADSMAAAVRYVQSDRLAAFPVTSYSTFVSEQDLGALDAPAAGCLDLDLGGRIGCCLLVLSPSGDHLFQVSKDAPKNVTKQLGLDTASRRAAVADFTKDGLLDLALCSGSSIVLAAHKADGTFQKARPIAAIEDCLSLECIEVAGPDGKSAAGLVAGTPAGPRLATPAAGGAFVLREPLAEPPADLGRGGHCVSVDVNGDGRCDIVELYDKGLRFHIGKGLGAFEKPATVSVPVAPEAGATLCGDFNADGRLDLVVGGKGRLSLLSRMTDALDSWRDLTYASGELDYHGNQNQPNVIALAACDLNADGRQGIAVFYAERKPLLFFNRGFSCFGWARTIEPGGGNAMTGATFFDFQPEEKQPVVLKALSALQGGTSAGTMLDIDADGLQDLVAVARDTHQVWSVRTASQRHAPVRSLVLRSANTVYGPRVVTVRDSERVTGMYVVRPGMPVRVPRETAGPAVLSWIGSDGKQRTERVVVLKKSDTFDLAE